MNSAHEYRPKRSDKFVLESFAGGFAIYDVSTDRTLECNATAALIWQLCDGSRTVADITHLLTEAYPEAPAIARDVASTLETFRSGKFTD